MRKSRVRLGWVLSILILLAMVAGSFASNPIISATEEGQKGCKSCHA